MVFFIIMKLQGAAADYGSWQNAHATVYDRGGTSAAMGEFCITFHFVILI
jgi:hypothetical protein